MREPKLTLELSPPILKPARLSLRIDPKLYARLRHAAIDRDSKVNPLMIEIIEDWLRRENQ